MELSEEQSMLADAVARFVGDQYSPSRRGARLAAGQRFDAAVWKTFAELGLLGAALPESAGGLGGNAVDHALIMQAFGNGLVLEPYVASVVLAGSVLIDARQGRWRDALLGDLASGEAVPVVAFVEPDSRYDPHHCRATARPVDGGWILDGHKCVVLGGGCATHFIVCARTRPESDGPDGLTLFVLHRDHPGLDCTRYATLDDRTACDLRLNGLRVGDDDRLGAVGDGGRSLSPAIDRALAASLAESVGIMDAMLSMTLEYLKTRQQFGRPLAANQALQHRLVDMHIAIEESRVMAMHAARALATTSAEDPRGTVSAAKVLVGQAMRLVGQEAIQLHGAIGTTYDAPISHYFKRLTALRAEYGDVDWHAGRCADALRTQMRAARTEGVRA